MVLRHLGEAALVSLSMTFMQALIGWWDKGASPTTCSTRRALVVLGEAVVIGLVVGGVWYWAGG